MAETARGEIGHLPFYITSPGETDTLYVIVVVAVVVAILMIGVLYLKLHALPEQMAHSSNHTQFQLVAVMALIALFTHNNLFWILALLLASIQLPDYEGLLRSISESLKKLAGDTDTDAVQDAADTHDATADKHMKTEA